MDRSLLLTRFLNLIEIIFPKLEIGFVYMKLQSFQLGQTLLGSRGRINLLVPMQGKCLRLPMPTPSLDHKVRVMPYGISVLGRYPSLMVKGTDFKHSPCDQHVSKG